jgi:hypothetical protein
MFHKNRELPNQLNRPNYQMRTLYKDENSRSQEELRKTKNSSSHDCWFLAESLAYLNK